VTGPCRAGKTFPFQQLVPAMKKPSLVILTPLTVLRGGLANAAEAKRALSHETLWLLKQVGAPAPSPDGLCVVVPVPEPAYAEKDEISD